MFMTGVHGRIVEQSETKFPRRCVTPGCEAYRENTDWDRGFMVGGLWTHGKMVLLDGMINNLDWAVGVTPAAHWLVDLYRGADGAPVPVRFGAGRFIDEVRAIGGPYPDGYTHNANVLDSLQNLLTHHAATRPVTTRDVVWLMSSGVASHEVSFDELLDPNALIVANMNASITQLYAEDGASLAIPWHHNGQVRTLTSPISLFADYALDPDAEDDIHLQNGATSLRWAVPPYGFIAAGAARIEPVALGGVEGRGLWLSGDAAVTWAMPAQPRPVPALYVGLFVDLRADDGFARELLTFPDGTRLRLTPEALVVERGASRRETALPPRTGWRHLALLVRDGGRSVMVLHDGYPIDRLTLAEPALQVPAGTLTLGRVQEPFSGLRGWVDDLVVLAHDVDPETACNHARGTLVRPVDPEWTAVAAEAPAWAHSELAAALGRPPGESYACYTDLSADYAAGLANLPAGSEPLRHLIQFPEGPLRAGQPRPDSSRNPFCLSCHTPEERGALGVEALVFRPSVPAEVDPRRQPMQPAPRVFGHVPAGWIAPGPGPGGPAEDLVAPAEGLLVDRWLLPP